MPRKTQRVWMNIERDFKQEEYIFKKVSIFIKGDTNREKGKLAVHVSDLLWCLRQSYYKKIIPQELTDTEVLRFFKGKVSEYAVGNFIFTEDHYLQQERIIANDMVAHPDIISHKDDLVIELKQTDKFGFTDPRDTIYNSFIYYTTQLLYYLFLTKKKKGSIIVNHSNYNMFIKKYDLKEGDSNPFRVFSITLDDNDYKIIEDDLNLKQKLFNAALQKKEIGYLPKLVTINMKDVSKCTKCVYKEQCDKDMDFWEENKINKVLEIRPGYDITTYFNERFQDFIKEGYGLIDVSQAADVNYLYNIISKKFGDLGYYYKQ